MEGMALEKKELGLMQREPSIFLSMERFEFAKKVAGMLAASTMVPDHFRGGAGVGNCMIMLNLSERLGIDVFGLMQTSYTVHGRPGFEAKLVIALFNERTKLFIPPLRWEMKGDFPKGKDAACRAYAKDKETGENLYGDWIDFDLIKGMGWYDKTGPDKKVESNMWRNMPGQMYRYRSASFFINAYEPGLKMGIQTIDELQDTIIDITPERTRKMEKEDGDPDTLIASFDEQFGEEVKGFVETLMKHYKKTEDEIKIEAMKDTANFTKGFESWTSKQKPTKVYEEAPEVMRGPEPEPITYTPKPEKQPERIDKSGLRDPFREEWIALRGAGFSTYVYKHLEQFRTSPYQQEAKVKWSKLYTEPWPLDPKPQTPAPADWTPVDGTKVPEQTPAEEVAAGIHRRHEEEKAEKKVKESNGPSIWCPSKSRFVFTRVCEENCDVTNKCQTYQEWEYQSRGPIEEQSSS